MQDTELLVSKYFLKGQKPQFADYLISIAMLVVSGVFIYLELKNVVEKNNFGLVLVFFGLISLRLCYSDYKLFANKINDKMYWLKNHIGRMTGAYIATFTAFIVVNNTILPPVIAWSLPTFIGALFIVKSIKKLSTN